MPSPQQPQEVLRELNAPINVYALDLSAATSTSSRPITSATVWCAVSPLLEGFGGVYCEDCNIARPSAEAQSRTRGVEPHVCDEDLADALWQRSEELCELQFSFG